MKLKTDHVTNSSSTAFIICNNTNEDKTLVDFVKENPDLIEDFNAMYGYTEEQGFTQEKLIESAEQLDEILKPGDNTQVFGDEDGTLIGHVFDYILRDGGTSESFSWGFLEYHR